MTYPTRLRPALFLALFLAVAPHLLAQDSAEIASLRAKAERGNAIAQYNLGLAYAEGRGLAKDAVEAFVWLSLAQENGARGRALENLVASLDRTSLESAQQILATRRAALGGRPATAAPAVVAVTPTRTSAVPATTIVPTVPAGDFDRQVEATLNRVSEEKATLERQLAAARADNTRLAADFAEAQRFAREVEVTLNRINDEKGNLANQLARATAAAAELEAARKFNQQVEATLNRVTEEKAALERQLAALPARPAAPAYPDLRGRVTELEQQLSARPAYPDLRGRVGDLEAQMAALAQQTDRARNEITALTSAKDAALAAVAAARSAAPPYPDLRGRVNELQDQLATLTRTRDEATESAGARSRQLATLEQDLQRTKAALAQAEQTLAAKPSAPAYPDLRPTVADLEKKLGEATAATGQSRRDVAAAQAEVTRLQQLVGETRERADAAERLRIAVQTAESGLRAANDKIAAFERTLPQLTSERDEARRQLAAKSSAPAFPDLRGRVGDLEGQIATLTTQAERAQRELTEANRVREDTARRLAAAETASRQAAALEAELQRTKSALAQAEQTLAARPSAPAFPDLRGRVAELEQQVAASREAQSALATSRSEAKDAQDRANAAASENRALQQRLAGLIAERDTLAGEVGQLRNRPAAPTHPDLSPRVAELEQQLAAATAGADATRISANRVRELEGRLTQAEQSRDAIARQFDEHRASTAAALRERTTLQSQVQMLESEKTALRRQIETDRENVARLNTQVAGLRTQLDARPSSPAFPDLRERVAELERQLTEASRPQTPAFPDLRGRVAELEQELTVARRPQTPAYPDLRARVGELETALSAASQPRTPAYPDLRGQVAELEQKLAAASATADRLAALSSEAAGMREQLVAATRARDEAAAALQTLRTDTAAAQQRATQAGSENNALQQRVASLLTERDNLAGEVAQLRLRPAAPAYPDLRERVADLERQLTDARRPQAPAFPDLRGRVGDLEAQLALTREQLAGRGPATPAYPDLRNRVTELEATVASLADRSTAAQQERTELQARFEDRNRVALAAERDRTSLAAQVRMLESEKTSQRRQAETAAEEANQLRTQIAGLRTELDAARRAPAAATPVYPDVRPRVAELETQLASATTALERAQAEAATAAATPQLRRERDELGTRVEQLAGEIASLRGDRERLQRLVADSGTQLRTSSAETVRVRTESEAALRAAQTRIAELESARAAAPAYPDLRDRVAELEQQLSTASQPRPPAYPDLRNRVAELETQLSTARAPRGPSYPDLRGRVGELEEQLTGTRRQLAALQGSSRTPPYPDLSGRVQELEAELAAARTRPTDAGAPADELAGRLAETEDKLATALRGYALLQRERDEVAERASRSAEELATERNSLANQVTALTTQVAELQAATTAQAEAAQRAETLVAERDTLAGQIASLTSEVQLLRTASQGDAASAQAEIRRLNESLAALQRSTSQASNELASTRELLRQVQGSNTLLATENQRLKGALAAAISPNVGAPTAPAVSLAGNATPIARTHTVVAGDSLSRISQRYYGTPNRWQEIFRANQAQLRNANALSLGMVLTLP